MTGWMNLQIWFSNAHVAVNSFRDEREVVITELLVRELKDTNMINGILLAFYMMINDRYKHE